MQASSMRFHQGPVCPDWVLSQLQDDGNGCLELFLGVVRREGVEGEVLALHYEAYESMAAAEFERLSALVLERHAIRAIAMEHALGTVPCGQCSIVLGIAAAHRQAVFAAGAEMMDLIKAELPVWKEERYRDGRRWIGRGS